MRHPFHNKRILAAAASAAAGFVILVFVSSIHVSAVGVSTSIHPALSVSPLHIGYGTVFPGEVLFEGLLVALSTSFLNDRNLDDVEYHIEQRIKPRNPADADYCQANPLDFGRCYPSLCPYLSKEVDGLPANDVGVPAFHDPANASSNAYGRLAKSDSDLADQWVVDLHVPCFFGQCAQDALTPVGYALDPELEHEFFGCDLRVVVDEISKFNFEGCTPGYWKQSQHFDSWPAPYQPNQLFSAYFENAFPGKTLLQVLNLGGGGLHALGRHTVAALLSAASSDVFYAFSPADVVSMFNAAFPGTNAQYETLKNTFAAENERSCPLN